MTLKLIPVLLAFAFDPVTDAIGPEVIKQADAYLQVLPVTITDFVAERSAGGIHDFYSEGDYWWPDPKNPDGPYIQRDGESNPDNFTAHRKAMVDMSMAVGCMTSAYLITKDLKYAQAVERHIQAWFINPITMMNPSLLYAQAIKGKVTGRGIGIIDTLHLLEVAQSLIRLEEEDAISKECILGARKWFTDYLDWMTTHEYGLSEMNAKNNHSTCWAVQAAIFARFTGNSKVLELCRKRFKENYMQEQMATDGSFPQELSRTKPYGYSLFNLDAIVTLCHILSQEGEDLWSYETPDGRSIHKALQFMLPYVQDKNSWPYKKDVMYWNEWPVAQPSFFLGWKHFKEDNYYQVWKAYDHFPTNTEVLRNLPLRNPVIWM